VIQDVNWLGRLPTVITEFPAFSFILGDLHPHLMALPFVLTGLALPLAWQPERERRPLGGAALAVAPLILGWLGFTNSWDLPTVGLIVVAAWAAGALRERPTGCRGWARWLGAALWLTGGSLLLYLPFYCGLQSQVQGIGAVHYAKTRLPSYLIVWAPWLLPIGLELWRRGQRLAWRAVLGLWGVLALLPWLAMLLVGGWGALLWGLVPLASAGPWLWLALSGALSVLLLDLRQRLLAEPVDGRGALWGLLCLVGLGLTYAIEFLYVRDGFDTRMNTVFKCSYQAWVLLGLCSLVAWAKSWRAGGGQQRWAAAALVILAVCGVYGPAAAYAKAGGYESPFSLDGTAFLAADSPDEYGAYRWLQANAGPSDVLVAAPGEPYHGWTSRLSGWTGAPTVLGWPGHEVQWRGSRQLVDAREREVDAFYRSFAPAEVAALRAHGATLVLVGPNERQRYGALPEAPPWQAVYASATVTLYRLP
jgi:YYY domain-containing protein